MKQTVTEELVAAEAADVAVVADVDVAAVVELAEEVVHVAAVAFVADGGGVVHVGSSTWQELEQAIAEADNVHRCCGGSHSADGEGCAGIAFDVVVVAAVAAVTVEPARAGGQGTVHQQQHPAS